MNSQKDRQGESSNSPGILLGYAGPILGLRPANERRRYYVMTSLIGWVQA